MSSAPKCDVCDELDATLHCTLCKMNLCAGDDADIHKPAKFASHQRTPIGAAATATVTAAAVPALAASTSVSAAAAVSLCAICDTDPATLSCVECNQQHCEPCSSELHKPARLAGHTRKPMGTVRKTSSQRSARGGPATPSQAKASPGLPPAPTPVASQPAEPNKAPPSARGSAAVAPSAPASLCELCESEPSTISCVDCDQQHCEPCSVGLHKPARLAGHTRKPIAETVAAPPLAKKASTSARGKGLPPSAYSVAAHAATNKPAETTASPRPAVSSPPAAAASPPAASAPAAVALCDLCESDPSTLSCLECDQQHCESCSVDLHKPARMAGHTRKPLGAAVLPAIVRRTSSSTRSAAVAPSTPQPQQQQQQAKPKSEEEKEPSPSKPAAVAPTPTPTPAAKTVRPSSAKPASSPAAKPAAATVASPSSPAPATPAPAAAKPRAMSASRSASSLRSPPSSQGRPRSAMPARSLGSNDGTSSTSSLLSGAPRHLQESLSPTRSVLSMSYGSRWEEPDVRPYKGEKVGTFGSTNRDGSPKRTKNLLYSKSASDLLGSGEGGGGSSSSGSASHWNRLSKPKVFVSSVISPLFDDVKECSFAPRINPLSSAIAPGAFHDRLAKSVDTYVTRSLRTEPGSLPPGATFQPQLNKSRSAGRLGTAAAPAPGNAAAAAESSPSSSNGGSSRAEFLARMHSDWAKRRANAEALAAASLCSFTPELSASSKRRSQHITTPFLERLSEDLSERDEGAAQRAEAAARLPYSFHPNPDRLATTRYSFDTFLARMEGDLDSRKEKYEERCRKFGLPTPEECVALSKTGQTHRSGGGSTRR